MTADANETADKTAPIEPGQQPELAQQPQRPRVRQFPGLVAISFYMILLAGVICFDVVAGGMPPLFLVFPVFFIASCCGLMFMLRWAWALALAAVALLAASFLWIFSTHGSDSALVQGLLNLVFFLYLVRPDLREKMR
jgi:hypothetical protein